MRSIASLTAALALALTLSVASGFAFSPSRHARSLATCAPFAQVPTISSHQSFGWGIVNCDPSPPSWNYTVRLVNHAGSILTQSSGGPINHSAQVDTQTVGCTGAVVHSYLYINVGGAGKSDTSGEIQC